MVMLVGSVLWIGCGGDGGCEKRDEEERGGDRKQSASTRHGGETPKRAESVAD